MSLSALDRIINNNKIAEEALNALKREVKMILNIFQNNHKKLKIFFFSSHQSKMRKLTRKSRRFKKKMRI